MTTILAGVGLAALLFAVFGTVRIGSGCGGDCGHCDETCGLQEVSDELG